MNSTNFCRVTALMILAALLCGCMGSPLQQTQPSSAVPTEPTAAPTTLAPTEAPTEVPTEAPTEVSTEVPTESLEKLELSHTELTLTEKSETLVLYTGSVPLAEVSWFSDDESIALFSQGTVVAINAGTTTVYAKYMDQVVSCLVTCDVSPEGSPGWVSSTLRYAPRLAPPVVEDMEDTSFFDDAAFIGDSVSYVLQQWHILHGGFGDATFLTRSSLGLQNSLDGQMQIFYQGKGMSPEDALAACGAKKVFIMLGFNDVAVYGIEGTIERWGIFMDRIQETCPNVEVYIQSCTSVHHDGAYPGYDNTLFDNYNLALEQFCQERGFHFVNIAPYFKDFNNGMPTRYSSDRFVHMTYEGTAVWERVLKAYAAEQTRGEAE